MSDRPAVLYVALYKPEIHPNTANIARLCAANEIPLYLVGTPGFRTDDRAVRRAGLDYWPYVDLRRVADLVQLREALPEARFFYFSARAKRTYTDVAYRKGDCLVFGPESRGLPKHVLSSNEETALTIPMRSGNVRSLNLATAAAIAVYETLRQIG